ncbi:MAG TPA: acylphosphatase [Planctomycetota bacterium]|nr:acylphosphatase [Planctomycetota bacterium]
MPDKGRKKKQPAKATPSAQPVSPKDTTGSLRLHVYFSGHVQGVGFRYTTASNAERFAVSGWVRNLSDGRVEMVAEGTMEELERFLGGVGDEMSGYISAVERTWEKPTGEFSGFKIADTE